MSLRVAVVVLVVVAAPLAAWRQQPAPKVSAADVKQEFVHAWEGYRQYAWGHDELLPLSKGAKDWHKDTLYMTPVDALDTMLIIGMKDEAEETKDYIIQNLRFDK